MNPLSTSGIGDRVEPEHEPGDFSPVGAVGLGVEQPEIGDSMGKVVIGDPIRRRRSVFKRRSTCGHGVPSQPVLSQAVVVNACPIRSRRACHNLLPLLADCGNRSAA